MDLKGKRMILFKREIINGKYLPGEMLKER
jgi:hypothetical protein